MATTASNPLAAGDTAYLYRAAIGSRGQEYYLKHFSRFDSEGKSGASWNWAAYWTTFNWLVYRKMWGRALAYVGTLVALALLAFGLGKLVFNYTDATAILLALLLLTGAFVLPGLYGNAWFHAHCNERISAALRQTQDMKQAAALLASIAPGQRRLLLQGLVNAVLLALAFGVYNGMLSMEHAQTEMAAATPSERPSAGGLSGQVRPLAPAPVATASAPVVPAAAPQPEASAPVVTASAEPAAPAAATAKPEVPVTAQAGSGPAKKADAAVAPAEKRAGMIATADRPAASSAASARAESSATTPPAESATPVAPRAAASAPRVRYVWVIQVGAYAQEENARKTLAQVQSLGLDAGADTVTAPQGKLMRVRVGPFTQQAEAEQAVLRIKSLDLPALLLRQRP